ncbi:MAG: HUIPC motif thioredoxin-like (seleno)protein [Bacillota bacterium]
MKTVVLEIPYEGDHCAPCVYMLETAEEAKAGFGDQVKLELIYLRQVDGALRYKALSDELGRPAPIPSLFINGRLCFEIIPAVEDLLEAIKEELTMGD